jgi:hypothetical protein
MRIMLEHGFYFSGIISIFVIISQPTAFKSIEINLVHMDITLFHDNEVYFLNYLIQCTILSQSITLSPYCGTVSEFLKSYFDFVN